RSIPISAMFSMMVLRMKACPQHSTGKEGVTISLDMLKDLERLIAETKPVSRHLAQLNMTATITGNILAGAAHCIGEVITVYPVEYEAQSDIRYNGVISHDGNIEYR
ncbi:MAG: hypothetical protein E7C46_15765, partial [Klebsiella grimontii]|nr:hypothetical protein [Klebsiella grimontii]